jgi:hypothetical protein
MLLIKITLAYQLKTVRILVREVSDIQQLPLHLLQVALAACQYYHGYSAVLASPLSARCAKLSSTEHGGFALVTQPVQPVHLSGYCGICLHRHVDLVNIMHVVGLGCPQPMLIISATRNGKCLAGDLKAKQFLGTIGHGTAS